MYSEWIDRLTRVKWDEQFPGQGATMLAQELAACFGTSSYHALTHRNSLTIDPPPGVPGLVLKDGVAVRGLMSWAKATADWVNAAGNDSYVQCVRSDSFGEIQGPQAYSGGTEVQQQQRRAAGALIVSDSRTTGPIKVFLPRSGGCDPNVRSGDLIAYTEDQEGNAIGVNFFLDQPIGSTMFWRGNPAAIRPGWQAISGAAGKFARAIGGGVAKDDTGGSESHDHGGTTAEAETGISADLSGLTVGSATTGLSISAHPGSVLNHTHAGITASLGLQSGDIDTTWLIGVEEKTFDDLPHNITDPGHTHSLSGSAGGLEDPGHSHGITSDTWLPPWYGIGVWIERVN